MAEEENTLESTAFLEDFFDDKHSEQPEKGGLADGFLKDIQDDGDEDPTEEASEEASDSSDETPEDSSEESDGETPDKDESKDEAAPDKDNPEEDDVPEEPPKGTSKKASEDWKKLRGSRDNYKTKATELERAVKEKESKLAELESKVTELEELRGKAAISAELEEKLKNYEELEKTVSLLRIEESPEYKKAVAAPLAAIEDQVVALGKENEAPLDEIFDAINEPDLAAQRTKLKAVTAGWDEIDKIELRNMAADARSLFGKQREMRENAATTVKQQEEMSKAEAERQAAEAKQAFLKASESVVNTIKEKVPFVPLRDGETVEDRMAALSEKLKAVDFESKGHSEKAVAAASALVLPDAIKTISHLQKEVKALEERLAKTNSAKPSKSDPVEDDADGEEDFFESIGIKSLNASQQLLAGR